MRNVWIFVVVGVGLSGCDGRGDRFETAVPQEGMAFDDVGVGDASVDEGVEEDAGPAVSPGPKRVFVTSRAWESELTSYARAESGVLSGDVVCQQVAEQAGLEGRFVAWLSDESTDAIDRVRGDGPFVRMDGEVLFPDRASLAGPTLAPINMNELGEVFGCGSGTTKVWTGTRNDGRWGLYDCVGWTSRDDDFDAMLGDICIPDEWSERTGGLRSCDGPYPIYCFEQ
jgi:hypothetical protein